MKNTDDQKEKNVSDEFLNKQPTDNDGVTLEDNSAGSIDASKQELMDLYREFEDRIDSDSRPKVFEEKDFFERKEPIYVDVAKVETKFDFSREKNEVRPVRSGAINWGKISSAELEPLLSSEEQQQEVESPVVEVEEQIPVLENPEEEPKKKPVVKKPATKKSVAKKPAMKKSASKKTSVKKQDGIVSPDKKNPDKHDLSKAGLLEDITKDEDYEGFISDTTKDEDYEGFLSDVTRHEDYESVVEMAEDTDYENKTSDDEWEIDPALLDDALFEELMSFGASLEAQEEDDVIAAEEMPMTKKSVNSKSKTASKPAKITDGSKPKRNRSKTAGLELPLEGKIIYIDLSEVKPATWEDVVKRKGRYSYHMTPVNNGGWFIKRSGSKQPSAYVADKTEALELAKQYAEKEKGTLKVHNKKGIITESYSFGRTNN